MNNYTGSIDTDMAIGSILSNFDSVIDAGPDYKEKINETKIDTYKEIITAICDYYGLVFTEPFEEINPVELYGIAHTMYDIFISRFTDYMIHFFVTYNTQTIDSIYNYLRNDDTVKKPRDKDIPVKSYVNPKFHIIHANLNKIVMNMISYDIPLNTLLSYFVDQNTLYRLSMLLTDTGDIFKNHYAVYLQDQRYMADLLTSIKLKLQSNTQEAFSVYNQPNQ